MNKITSIYTQEDENSTVNEVEAERFSTITHLPEEIEVIPKLVTPNESVTRPFAEREMEEEVQLETSKMKVGERLRHARENKNLSIQHIADRLYLSPTVINALEMDDYDRLPSAVFVRGYLRNYAKLLEISPELVIEGYEQQQGHQLPSAIVPAGESPAPQVQTTSNHFWVKTMTFSVITVVMILLSVTIVSQNLFSKRTDVTTTTTEIPLQLPDSEGLSGEPLNPPLVPLLPAVGADVAPGAETPPLTTPQPTTAENTTVPTTETMTIYLKQKSWLEITDSTNKKLYNGIANANTDFSVTGIPHFKVKVGNLDAVSIEYRGEKNPISSYTKQPNTNGRIFLVGENTPTTEQP
jgi:cytoskeleton protein RodZ